MNRSHNAPVFSSLQCAFALVLVTFIVTHECRGQDQPAAENTPETSVENTPQNSAENAIDKIKQLQQDRVKILQQSVQLAERAYREGQLTFRATELARTDLLAAQLELAQSPKDKVKILSQRLKLADAALKATEARYNAGDVSIFDSLQARSAKIKVEISLLKAKQAAEAAEQASLQPVRRRLLLRSRPRR